MARAKRTEPQMSREEILERAAWNVAHTIDPEAMGMPAEKVPVEEFIKYFKEKTNEMLNQREERMLLTIGPYMNSGMLFSEDLQPIMDYVEEKVGIEFQFFNGIIVYLGPEDVGIRTDLFNEVGLFLRKILKNVQI